GQALPPRLGLRGALDRGADGADGARSLDGQALPGFRRSHHERACTVPPPASEGAMSLIVSPRHSRADLEHWKKLEAFDAVLARSEALTRKEAKALQVIREFASQGPCYVGTSWGKDSIVVAHLAWRLYAEGLRLPVAWLPAGRLETPDCPRVRDAFLARFPVDYHEVEAASEERPWGETEGHDGAQEAFEREARRFGTRYISGVRAEESSIRRLRMRMDGEISKNTCRPIGWWKGEEVFAYLHKYD